MILWMVKLFSSLRRAVAGRKYPSQLSWAVSFGLLLGIVPHGNLLAIAILIVVLSLRINHAMAGLTAVASSFLATRLDPYSTQIGQWVLSHPNLQDSAKAAWQLPLVPWTDLNNTVVMGSLLIGTGALVPVFLVTYPIFRFLAPRPKVEQADSGSQQKQAQKTSEGVHQVVLVDPSHQTVTAPHRRPKTSDQRPPAASGPSPSPTSVANTSIEQPRVDTKEVPRPVSTKKQPASTRKQPVASPRQSASRPTQATAKSDATITSVASAETVKPTQQPNVDLTEPNEVVETVQSKTTSPQDSTPDFVEIDHDESGLPDRVAVETRIDVIRMQDHRDVESTQSASQARSADATAKSIDATSTNTDSEQSDQPMDEALNYLLRQLRDSKQRKAA